MFFNLIRRFRRAPALNRPRQPAHVLGDIVARKLDGALPPSFQRIGDLQWVSVPTDHIRYLLRFEPMKGMSFSACWGISIDFVPIFRSGNLHWKRTAKSANFDLCIDPIDTSGHIEGWCSFYWNDHPRYVERAAVQGLKAARRDWSAIRTLKDVPGAFEKRSKITFRRFSLENYVQTDLAWGLALVAVGETDPGQRRLDRFCETFSIARDDPILTSAKHAATTIASG